MCNLSGVSIGIFSHSSLAENSFLKAFYGVMTVVWLCVLFKNCVADEGRRGPRMLPARCSVGLFAITNGMSSPSRFCRSDLYFLHVAQVLILSLIWAYMFGH
jgi:hypothetical protein